MRFYVYDKNDVGYKRFRFIRFKWIIYFIFAQIVMVLSLLFFLSNYSITPKEKKLQSEVNFLMHEFDNINKRIIQSETILRHIQETDSIIYETLFDPRDVSKKSFEVYYEMLVDNNYSKIVHDMNIRISKLDDAMAKELYILTNTYAKAIDKKDMLTHIPAIQPLDNKDLRRTSSGWGMRTHPVFNINRFHYGLDFVAPVGTPVYATGDARVEQLISHTSRRSQGYGNLIVLDHGWGYRTLYAHLDKWSVVVGEDVKRGQIIGYIGNTGISTGPHLHYEVMKNGRKVNPINYLFNSLTPEEYRKIVEISNSIKISMD